MTFHFSKGLIGKVVKINYTNWKGETETRNLEITDLWFGSTKFHPTAQLLARCWDFDKQVERDFSIDGFDFNTLIILN